MFNQKTIRKKLIFYRYRRNGSNQHNFNENLWSFEKTCYDRFVPARIKTLKSSIAFIFFVIEDIPFQNCLIYFKENMQHYRYRNFDGYLSPCIKDIEILKRRDDEVPYGISESPKSRLILKEAWIIWEKQTSWFSIWTLGAIFYQQYW